LIKKTRKKDKKNGNRVRKSKVRYGMASVINTNTYHFV